MMIRFRSDTLKNTALALLLIAFSAGLALLRLVMNGVPAAPPAPEAGGPDPARLQAHVRALAAEPHPIGSAAHEKTRRYILDALRTEGIETTTQDTAAVSPLWLGFSNAGRVRNVIARLPGRAGADAILLVGHYDSVATGPGAADDGSAVAGMLETARLLKAAGPLRNDVLFLFSDGEEIGLVGAGAFARESPLMSRVRAVFNFEARGSRGPVLLFETGPGSERLVRDFLAVDPRPQGTSLATAVYGLLPNNTDFTVFKERGVPGLNFACIGDMPCYHTMLDNPGRLDPRTLSLQAGHALTCARTFGDADLSSPGRGELVFFPVIGALHAVYSTTAAVILAVASLALLTFVVTVGIRAQLLSIGKLLVAAGAVLLLAALSGGLAWGGTLLIGALHPENRSLYEPYNAAWYRIALGLLPLFPAALIRRWWGRRLSSLYLHAGACVSFALLLALTAAVLPGISYLFQWPLFFAIPLLGLLLLRDKKPLPRGVVPAAIALLCAPAILLGVNTFSLGSEALTLAFTWLFVPVLALLLAAAWPLFDLTLERGGMLLPLLAGASFAAVIAGGLLTSGFSSTRPLPETLAYGLDADQRRAMWITCPNRTLAWTGQFFPAQATVAPLESFMPLTKGCLDGSTGYRQAPAPFVNLAPPVLSVHSAVRGGRGRDLTLLLRSPRGAARAIVFIERPPGPIGVSIDGKEIVETPIEKMKPIYRTILEELDHRRWLMISFFNLPAEGVEMRLSAAPDTPLLVKLIDVSGDLPEQALRGFAPRPPSSMPGESLVVPNGTLVAKEYRF